MDLASLARRAAGSARSGEQVEVYVARSSDTEVRVHAGEVESLSAAATGGVGVRVVADRREGFAWVGSLDPDEVEAAVARARENAFHTTPDEHVGLATPASFAGVAVAELELWRDELGQVDADAKVALALELERATVAADPRVRAVESASYHDGAIEVALSSSTGVEIETRRTTCAAASFALADDGRGTQTGFGFTIGRAPSELDPERAGRDAARRATRLLGARRPASRRLPAVFDPIVTASLLGLVGAACNGEAIAKGRSMFARRLGEEVAAPAVTLVDDPTDHRSPGAASSDAEGVPTRPTCLVEDGVLRAVLQHTVSGRRAGTASTGSAVRSGFRSTPSVGARALRLEPGARCAEDVLGSLDDALYVQSVSGLHSGTNPVSGDFSVGAEGLLVRAGAFAEPVRELTIASTLQRLLRDVVELATDLTWFPGGTAGLTLLVGEVQMSGG